MCNWLLPFLCRSTGPRNAEIIIMKTPPCTVVPEGIISSLALPIAGAVRDVLKECVPAPNPPLDDPVIRVNF